MWTNFIHTKWCQNPGTEAHLTGFPTEPPALVAMDLLRRVCGIVRAAFTTTLNSLDDVLRAASPSPPFDKEISEAVPDEEFEEEMATTITYTEIICSMRFRARDSLTTRLNTVTGLPLPSPTTFGPYVAGSQQANRSYIKDFSVQFPSTAADTHLLR